MISGVTPQSMVRHQIFNMRLIHRVRRLFSMLALHFSRHGRQSALPPLPRHPERGLRVEAGDTLTITNMSISVQDLSEIEGVQQRTYRMRIPPWSDDFKCGATIALRRRIDEGNFNVDGNRVDVVEGGWVVEIGLKNASQEPFRHAHELAERTLDLLAADMFRISELHDPLRHHSIWFRKRGEITLRIVTSARLGITMRSAAVVRDPSGAVRPPAVTPPRKWHASHAYFRRSQSTDNLHEAYRNLFLGLEALLSEVYPWEFGMGETAWLRQALQHVVAGYGLDLSQFVGGSGGNPYRRFLKEQYRARRCALFHAKLAEGPIVPGDVATREELVAATRKLGQLYIRLSQLITGAGFSGGAMSYAGFEAIIKGFEGSPMYVSGSSDFNISDCVQSPSQFVAHAYGQPGVHLLRANWQVTELPRHLRRAGLLLRQEQELTDGLYNQVDVHTDGADLLEFVIQNELANAEHLREWFL